MLLTLYHTVTTYKEMLLKTLLERRKCRKPPFSPFPTMFSTHHKTNFTFLNTCNFLSANAFNLDQSKILSFGNGLKCFYLRVIKSVKQNGRKCQ